MWSIRFLNGPQAGKILALKPGKNLLGRGSHCDVQIPSAGASKEHCEISVYPDKIIISDLRSRNGTLLNGVRIQNGFLKVQDKIGVHDIIFEIIPGEARPQMAPTAPQPMPFAGAAAPQYDWMNQPAQEQVHAAPAPQAYQPQGLMQGLVGHIKEYIERVALPGVYKLPEVAEFRWVIAGFMSVLIVMVTLLCMIPAMEVTKSSLVTESKRRAQSLARSLAQLNQTALLQGSFASVSTHSIESEDGVKQAYIVQQVDGVIVAPATLQGRQVDLPFVHTARKESKSQVAVIDGDTIGASFPIGVYDPSTGEPSVKYHAIIIYSMGSMALDEGRAISLFMQSLLISFLFGLILFYFLYKMIEYPVESLNAQLDTALREKKDNLFTDYQYPALQNLVSNINSLLTRYIHGGGDSGSPAAVVSFADEGSKIADMVDQPCIVIKNDGQILNLNSKFEQLAHVSKDQLRGQLVHGIPDQALQQNLEFLMSRARENPFTLHSDNLEFSGVQYTIQCQAFGQPVDYFVITIGLPGGFE